MRVLVLALLAFVRVVCVRARVCVSSRRSCVQESSILWLILSCGTCCCTRRERKWKGRLLNICRSCYELIGVERDSHDYIGLRFEVACDSTTGCSLVFGDGIQDFIATICIDQSHVSVCTSTAFQSLAARISLGVGTEVTRQVVA